MSRPKRGRPGDVPPDEFTTALQGERNYVRPPMLATVLRREVYARIRIPAMTLDEMGKILKEMAHRDLMESLRSGTYLTKLLEK